MEPITAATAVVLIVAFNKKLVDLVITVVPSHLSDLTKLVLSFIFGVAQAFVLRASDLGSGIAVGDHNLAAVNEWTTVIVGLFIAGGASIVNDVLAAVDNSRSSRVVSATAAE